ncbi:MAG: immunoglobulin domain-containing protein, partial [Planctomycetota bacterium]
MIRKFLAKVFRGTRAKRNVSTTKKRGRRIAIEPLESRRLLAVTGGLSGFAYLDVHDFGTKDADEAGFAGLTVRLKSVGSQGNLSDVSGVGPFQTLAGGAYSFNGLAAGTYQIQISPSSKLAVGVLSVGSAGGTAGSNEIQVTLAADQVATDYNFAILGAQTNQISLRMFMASTGSLTDFLTTLHTAPSSTTGGSSISSFSATYTTGGPAMAVVSSNATLTAADSPTLTAMTVTLQNPQDGSSEQLSADTTGTLLTSNYANNVLTVSGVANVADYQTVLRTVKYGITAWPAQAGDRTLSIVINDGTATSTAAISTINVVQGTEAAPTVTTNPIASTVNAGNMATFTAAASANPASTVQWMVNTGSGFVSLSNDAVYSGVTTTTLTITGATAGLSGNQYEAVFTNSFGTATTTPATLTVDHVTTAPTSQTINVSQNAIFTTASSNPSGSDTVQWKVNTGSGFVSLSNDAIYSGVTATTLVVTGATAGLNNNQYEAVFTNSTGTLTSSLATLTVDHVTTAPASQTINAGLNTSFTAISSNPSGSDTVQWKVNTGSGFVSLSNDAIYGGVTTTTLAITGATAGLNGNQYEAVFTNSLGTIASSAAMLTVNYAPIVTASPVASAVNAGNMATFTAAATSGNPASTVQWKVNTGSGFVSLSNDTVYSGVTTTTLAIAGATAGLSGNQYEAVFTNSIGFATTTPATLTVDHVTTAPTSQTINASLNTTFTAISSNPSGSDTVQWKVNTGSGFVFLSNDTTYGGVTTTILTITGATAGMNGNQYEAVFTNSAGMIASSPATLTVNYAPIVTVSPVASTVNAGNTATFTAAANGSPTPTVQWMMNAGSGFVPLSNDTIYSGATTTTLVITGATAGMNGNQYEAIFTNSIGSATTAPAALTVDYVATAPTPQTIDVGQNTTFTAISSNPSGSDTVQWKVNTGSGFVFLSSNDLVYSGVTTTTLTITGATTGLNGNQYEAVFTNGAGTLTSSPATLTVNYAPIVATSPVSSMVNVENTATFTATANGSPTPTVQWMVNTGSGFVSLSNDIVYSGVTTTTLTITGATADLSGNQYEAVFTNIFGTATTTPATLTVDHVTTAPTSQTINAGLNTSFTA